MKEKILELVGKICNTNSTDCRSLNKKELARKLMDYANIPNDVEILEIPLDWNNQVVILFIQNSLSDDYNYYSLFAGIGNDGKFYFQLSITGTYTNVSNGYYFNFFDEEKILPIDYFKN